MSPTIRTILSDIYTNTSNYIKTKMDFVVEISIVVLFFGAMLNKFLILN
ncbi:uncharacterized protein LOC131995202 [Stomoxys calcitrans]|nr:uncharacterized protein LOC131995202 [Stomoxys calcitrans]